MDKICSEIMEVDLQQLKVFAVLPAGGSGDRMKLQTPKQFSLIEGRPLISITIEQFERLHWIDKVFVCVSRKWWRHAEYIIERYEHFKVILVESADTRHQSIFNGVKDIVKDGANDSDIVIVHDAVRPFVTENIIEIVARAAFEFGAAGAVRPLISTVVAADINGYLVKSLDRQSHRRSEMPQAFRYEVIKTAYEKCTDHDLKYGTECLHLAQTYAGCRVKLIESSEDLWKVTLKRDLYAAKAVFKELGCSSYTLIDQGTGDLKLIEKLRNAFNQHMTEVVWGTETNSGNSPANVVVVLLSPVVEEYNIKSLISCSQEQKASKGNGVVVFLLKKGCDECIIGKVRHWLQNTENSKNNFLRVGIVISQNTDNVVTMVEGIVTDRPTYLHGQILYSAD